MCFFLTGCISQHQEMLYQKEPGFYSYIIEDVQDGRVATEHDADVFVTPASCQKVITALLAYKVLGDEFRYETRLYVTRKHGKPCDAIIAFSGDPTLRSEDLKKLLEPIRNTSFSGRVILDASLFQTQVYSENVMKDDMGTSYGQPVSSMNVDKNLIDVKVTPTMLGKGAYVTNDAGYEMCSGVVTAQKDSIRCSWEREKILVKGTIGAKEQCVQVSPLFIGKYMKRKIAPILKDLSIQGKVVVLWKKQNFSGKEFVSSVFSEPLRVIIPPALKQSDNLVFDSLFLKIVNQSRSGIRSWREGDAVIKSLLKNHFDVDMATAFFVDGSGLSRYNRMQPRVFVELLRKGFSCEEFVAALPVPGEQNTTLEERTALPSDIRAKTGSMTGISSICGYAKIHSQPKVFAFFASNFCPKPSSEEIVVQDEFLAECLK